MIDLLNCAMLELLINSMWYEGAPKYLGESVIGTKKGLEKGLRGSESL